MTAPNPPPQSHAWAFHSTHELELRYSRAEVTIAVVLERVRFFLLTASVDDLRRL